jgi:fructose-1,6-bisphosphatase/inositol monophosphatase family enzyme
VATASQPAGDREGREAGRAALGSDASELIATLFGAAAAVRAALSALDDWGPAGTRPGQYRSDLVADEACLQVLTRAGLGAVSEESGPHDADRELVAVVDPLDGSTNAARGLPWFATSICVLDEVGPLAAVVVNQASGVRYDAYRGAGSRRDGAAIRPSSCGSLSQSFVGLSGYPRRYLGWRQYRALGAQALDLCAVADGTLDGYVDCTDPAAVRAAGGDWGAAGEGGAHGSWDYLGGLLVCDEAGAVMADVGGRDLVVRDHSARRTPVAAGTRPLLEELIAVRRA